MAKPQLAPLMMILSPAPEVLTRKVVNGDGLSSYGAVDAGGTRESGRKTSMPKGVRLKTWVVLGDGWRSRC